jgi:hypothetical protein
VRKIGKILFAFPFNLEPAINTLISEKDGTLYSLLMVTCQKVEGLYTIMVGAVGCENDYILSLASKSTWCSAVGFSCVRVEKSQIRQ